jgi:hypothetical protein
VIVAPSGTEGASLPANLSGNTYRTAKATLKSVERSFCSTTHGENWHYSHEEHPVKLSGS